ncbi:MAG: metallophosphoesterase [Lachnospiraceae bacterium]|nr:metallophosphoesterase [Lachnospiraceae bacterium]
MQREGETMIYITGDTHGDMSRIVRFCERVETSKEDCMIILGDVGLNYYGDSRDRKNKEKVASLPITLFCIHGNHERRPATISEYKLHERRKYDRGKVDGKDE